MESLVSKHAANHFAGDVQVSAFKLASPFVLALNECDPKLRDVALELFEQLGSGELDPEQACATTALIAEILFPNADHRGEPGLDLEEAEKLAISLDPSAGPLIAAMDHQEATFANRLRLAMDEKGLTQAELAKKVGIGQPAISMMLNRTCRPQRKTIHRIANALSINPEELWPTSPSESGKAGK
ncbi:MAG: helix-turn-helix transcriptional regulator [Planctomycetes bacterium]|nr:helix-turn-helix transcriptional regulator [Planctomycetota bacterium]